MRPNHPWYWAAKNAWFVELGDKRHCLGKHPEGVPAPKKRKKGDPPPKPPGEVERAYHRLMATEQREPPRADALLACQVCDLFLDYSQKHHQPETYRGYFDFLQDFCEQYGTLLARDLKPLHVTRWLDAHPGWKGCRRNAVVAIKRAFNWADSEGILQPSPLKGVKKPRQNRRSRVLTPQERAEILTTIKDRQFRDFVTALMETGARPGEVRKVTAAHVNLELGVWVFGEHKTAHKTGRPRVIYLTPAMVAMSRRLMAERPEGPLFRGPRGGKPFSKNGVRCRFKRLREKLPHLKGVISYT